MKGLNQFKAAEYHGSRFWWAQCSGLGGSAENCERHDRDFTISHDIIRLGRPFKLLVDGLHVGLRNYHADLKQLVRWHRLWRRIVGNTSSPQSWPRGVMVARSAVQCEQENDKGPPVAQPKWRFNTQFCVTLPWQRFPHPPYQWSQLARGLSLARGHITFI